MKTSFIVVGLIIIAMLGYYFFVPSPTQTEAPTTGMGAKIDINAICNGALAYMTFPSGAEADAFVADCKAGNRPEVIEQWKQQNGITDDRAI